MLTPYFFYKYVRTEHDNYDLAWGPPGPGRGGDVRSPRQQKWYHKPDPVPETISVDIMRSLLPRLSEVNLG